MQHNRQNRALGRWAGLLVFGLALLGTVSVGLADGVDELEGQGLPVFSTRGGYVLALTDYEVSTKAELLEGEPAKHKLSLKGLMLAPQDDDVLCFRTSLDAKSAEGDRGKELLGRGKPRRQTEYKAVLPSSDFTDRRGKPMLLTAVALDDVELDRPGYEVERLELEVDAVLVEEREQAELPAIVADRFVDIGNDTEVKVTAMEVDKKGEMTVKLQLKRRAGDRSAVIDSLYALDEDGDPIGGGRWTNELDLFSSGYEVEMTFPLSGRQSIDKLQVVLATEYEVVPVKIGLDVQRLFEE